MLRLNDLKESNINKKTDYTIGIYSIFIGNYEIFYEEFIKSINNNFFPGVKKKIFIITNKNLQSYENTYILKVSDKFINFPFPTLFRFRYFRKIPFTELKQVDYMFFLNGNAVIKEPINISDLPINKSRYIFTLHNGYYKCDYNSIPFEKNKHSSAYIPAIKDFNYTYIGGGFFGGFLLNFINLCNINYRNILTDLKKGYIAVWHDESHINKYFFDLKVNNHFLAGINYHIPEKQENKKDFKYKKIIYLDKSKKLNMYPKNWKEKKVKYIHNAGNEITYELIQFYDK